MNVNLGNKIRELRKGKNISQEVLAQYLGVSFQAVSKWETAKSAPDVVFLPIMADIFGCYIDELFSRTVRTEIVYSLCAELPWNDDHVMREVLCDGKKIIKVEIVSQ